MEPLRIGQLAAAAGVGVETIRYYQRRRLLATPPKPYGGQRVYPAAFVDRLRFVKRAQSLGFSLDDVAALLELNDGTGHRRARALARHRRGEIEARIADLTMLRDLLDALIRECEHTAGRARCPIIATLSQPAAAPTETHASSRSYGTERLQRARVVRRRASPGGRAKRD